MEDSLQLRGVTPPNSVEAERSVLGAMLQDSGAVLQAAEELEENDFYTPAHREIFSGMIQLHRNQSPVDLVTVDAELICTHHRKRESLYPHCAGKIHATQAHPRIQRDFTGMLQPAEPVAGNAEPCGKVHL